MGLRRGRERANADKEHDGKTACSDCLLAYRWPLTPVTSPLVGQGYRIWLAACSGYLPPCGGGRIARHPKSAVADFGVHIGQVGNIRLGTREPGRGGKIWRIENPPPHPSPSPPRVFPRSSNYRYS